MKSNFPRLMVLLLFMLALASCGQVSNDESLRKGSELYEKGDLRGAIVHLKNAVEKDPNFFEARYLLGKIYLDSQRFDQAEPELLKVSMQSPDYKDVHYQLAKVSLYRKRFDEAIKEANLHLNKNRADAKALDIIGRAHAMNQNLPDAEQRFKEAIEADPSYVDAKINLARLYISIGRNDAVRNILNEVISKDPKEAVPYFLLAELESLEGNLPKSLEIYERYLKIAPDNAEALYRTGLQYFFKGDRAGLEQSAKRLKALAKETGNPDADLLEGLAAFSDKNFAQAVAMLQKAISRKPRVIGEYFLGMAHFRQNSLEQALSSFQHCLDAKPDAVMPRLMLAVTLLKQKRLNDALAAAKAVLNIEPSNPEANLLVGDILVQMKRFDEAVAYFDKGSQAGQGKAVAKMRMGIARFQQGDQAAGETELAQSLRLDPDLLDSRLALATSLYQRQKFDEAIAILKKGLNGTSSDGVLNIYIAQSYLAKGKIAEAKQHLQAAQRAAPDFADPYTKLAAIWASEGNYRKAGEEYQNLLAKSPNNLDAQVNAAKYASLAGDDAKAMELLQRARKSGDGDNYRPLLSFLVAKRKTDSAVSLMEEVTKARPEDPNALEDKGRLMADLGRFDEAMESFRKIAPIDSMRSASLQVQGLLLANKPDEAAKLAEETVKAKQDNPQCYLLLSAVRKHRKDLKGAMDALAEAPASVGVDPRVMTQKGILAELMGDKQRAMSFFEDTLRRNPGFLEAKFALASLSDVMGNKAKAETVYKEILAEQPDHSLALNNLAYLLSEKPGQLDQALALSLRAYRNSPTSSSVADTLGYILYLKKDYKQSQELLEKNLARGGRGPGSLYHLGLVYKALGQKSQAEKMFKEALAVPNFPERAKTIEDLAKLSR